MSKPVDYDERAQMSLHIVLFVPMGAWLYSAAGWIPACVIAVYYFCYAIYCAYRANNATPALKGTSDAR